QKALKAAKKRAQKEGRPFDENAEVLPTRPKVKPSLEALPWKNWWDEKRFGYEAAKKRARELFPHNRAQQEIFIKNWLDEIQTVIPEEERKSIMWRRVEERQRRALDDDRTKLSREALEEMPLAGERVFAGEARGMY